MGLDHIFFSTDSARCEAHVVLRNTKICFPPSVRECDHLVSVPVSMHRLTGVYSNTAVQSNL